MELFLLPIRKHMYILIVVLIHMIDQTHGDGYVQTNFKTFVNYDGKRFDGECCDKGGGWFWAKEDGCSNPCDHSFVLCIGNGTQSSDMTECEFGVKKINKVGGNNITFNSHVGKALNPVKFQFRTWPGVIKLKIDVSDDDEDDDGGYDFVDHYEYQYNTHDLRREIDTPEHELVLKGRRTRFNMGLKVYCDLNYYGSECQIYCKETNDESGHFRCDPVTGEKLCLSGWKGSDCLQNIDDCIGHRCYFGATCVDGINYYSCHCPPGRTGRLCGLEINECASVPCQNGGTCLDELNGFICKCNAGYVGRQCEIELNECASGPCLNGGECIDSVASFSCECRQGFEGERCEVDINECAANPCARAVRCIDLPGDYQCECFPGFTGKTCEFDINECDSNPCQNGWCFDDSNAFKCICSLGYTGIICDTLIDHCKPNYCINGATCIGLLNDYECQCLPGYEGRWCDVDINECKRSPNMCGENGQCVNTEGNFFCHCKKGYEGSKCEVDTDECLLTDEPCLNGGTCVDLIGEYRCECVGFYGYRCENDINECESDPCVNGGFCNDLKGTFICDCPIGFTGDICDIITSSTLTTTTVSTKSSTLTTTTATTDTTPTTGTIPTTTTTHTTTTPTTATIPTTTTTPTTTTIPATTTSPAIKYPEELTTFPETSESTEFVYRSELNMSLPLDQTSETTTPSTRTYDKADITTEQSILSTQLNETMHNDSTTSELTYIHTITAVYPSKTSDSLNQTSMEDIDTTTTGTTYPADDTFVNQTTDTKVILTTEATQETSGITQPQTSAALSEIMVDGDISPVETWSSGSSVETKEYLSSGEITKEYISLGVTEPSTNISEEIFLAESMSSGDIIDEYRSSRVTHSSGDELEQGISSGDLVSSGEITEEHVSSGDFVSSGEITEEYVSSGDSVSSAEMTEEVIPTRELVSSGEITEEYVSSGDFVSSGEIAEEVISSGDFVSSGEITEEYVSSGDFVSSGEITEKYVSSGDFVSSGEITEEYVSSGDSVTSGEIIEAYVSSGDSVSSGEIIEAYVSSGDSVSSGEIIEVYVSSGDSVSSGEITEVYVSSGELVSSGEIIEAYVSSGDSVSSGEMTEEVILSGELVSSGEITEDYVSSGDFVSSGEITEEYASSGDSVLSGKITEEYVSSGDSVSSGEIIEVYVSSGDSVSSGEITEVYVSSDELVSSGEIIEEYVSSGDSVSSGEMTEAYVSSGDSVSSGEIIEVYVSSGDSVSSGEMTEAYVSSGDSVSSGEMTEVYVSSDELVSSGEMTEEVISSGELVSSGEITEDYVSAGDFVSSGEITEEYASSGHSVLSGEITEEVISSGDLVSSGDINEEHVSSGDFVSSGEITEEYVSSYDSVLSGELTEEVISSGDFVSSGEITEVFVSSGELVSSGEIIEAYVTSGDSVSSGEMTEEVIASGELVSSSEITEEYVSSGDLVSSVETIEAYVSSGDSVSSGEMTEEVISSGELVSSGEITEEYVSSGDFVSSGEITEEYVSSGDSVSSGEMTEEVIPSVDLVSSGEITEEYDSSGDSISSEDITDEYISSGFKVSPGDLISSGETIDEVTSSGDSISSGEQILSGEITEEYISSGVKGSSADISEEVFSGESMSSGDIINEYPSSGVKHSSGDKLEEQFSSGDSVSSSEKTQEVISSGELVSSGEITEEYVSSGDSISSSDITEEVISSGDLVSSGEITEEYVSSGDSISSGDITEEVISSGDLVSSGDIPEEIFSGESMSSGDIIDEYHSSGVAHSSGDELEEEISSGDSVSSSEKTQEVISSGELVSSGEITEEYVSSGDSISSGDITEEVISSGDLVSSGEITEEYVSSGDSISSGDITEEVISSGDLVSSGDIPEEIFSGESMSSGDIIDEYHSSGVAHSSGDELEEEISSGDSVSSSEKTQEVISSGDLVSSGEITEEYVSSGDSVSSGEITEEVISSGDLVSSGDITEEYVSSGDSVLSGDITEEYISSGVTGPSADISKDIFSGELMSSGYLIDEYRSSGVTHSSGVELEEVISSGDLIVSGELTEAYVSSGGSVSSDEITEEYVSSGDLSSSGEITDENISSGLTVSSGDLISSGDISEEVESSGHQILSGDQLSGEITKEYVSSGVTGTSADISKEIFSGESMSPDDIIDEYRSSGDTHSSGDIPKEVISSGDLVSSGEISEQYVSSGITVSSGVLISSADNSKEIFSGESMSTGDIIDEYRSSGVTHSSGGELEEGISPGDPVSSGEITEEVISSGDSVSSGKISEEYVSSGDSVSSGEISEEYIPSGVAGLSDEITTENSLLGVSVSTDMSLENYLPSIAITFGDVTEEDFSSRSTVSSDEKIKEHMTTDKGITSDDISTEGIYNSTTRHKNTDQYVQRVTTDPYTAQTVWSKTALLTSVITESPIVNQTSYYRKHELTTSNTNEILNETSTSVSAIEYTTFDGRDETTYEKVDQTTDSRMLTLPGDTFTERVTTVAQTLRPRKQKDPLNPWVAARKHLRRRKKPKRKTTKTFQITTTESTISSAFETYTNDVFSEHVTRLPHMLSSLAEINQTVYSDTTPDSYKEYITTSTAWTTQRDLSNISTMPVETYSTDPSTEIETKLPNTRSSELPDKSNEVTENLITSPEHTGVEMLTPTNNPSTSADTKDTTKEHIETYSGTSTIFSTHTDKLNKSEIVQTLQTTTHFSYKPSSTETIDDKLLSTKTDHEYEFSKTIEQTVAQQYSKQPSLISTEYKDFDDMPDKLSTEYTSNKLTTTKDRSTEWVYTLKDNHTAPSEGDIDKMAMLNSTTIEQSTSTLAQINQNLKTDTRSNIYAEQMTTSSVLTTKEPDTISSSTMSVDTSKQATISAKVETASIMPNVLCKICGRLPKMPILASNTAEYPWKEIRILTKDAQKCVSTECEERFVSQIESLINATTQDHQTKAHISDDEMLPITLQDDTSEQATTAVKMEMTSLMPDVLCKICDRLPNMPILTSNTTQYPWNKIKILTKKAEECGSTECEERYISLIESIIATTQDDQSVTDIPDDEMLSTTVEPRKNATTLESNIGINTSADPADRTNMLPVQNNKHTTERVYSLKDNDTAPSEGDIDKIAMLNSTTIEQSTSTLAQINQTLKTDTRSNIYAEQMTTSSALTTDEPDTISSSTMSVDTSKQATIAAKVETASIMPNVVCKICGRLPKMPILACNITKFPWNEIKILIQIAQKCVSTECEERFVSQIESLINATTQDHQTKAHISDDEMLSTTVASCQNVTLFESSAVINTSTDHVEHISSPLQSTEAQDTATTASYEFAFVYSTTEVADKSTMLPTSDDHTTATISSSTIPSDSVSEFPFSEALADSTPYTVTETLNASHGTMDNQTFTTQSYQDTSFSISEQQSYSKDDEQDGLTSVFTQGISQDRYTTSLDRSTNGSTTGKSGYETSTRLTSMGQANTTMIETIAYKATRTVDTSIETSSRKNTLNTTVESYLPTTTESSATSSEVSYVTSLQTSSTQQSTSNPTYTTEPTFEYQISDATENRDNDGTPDVLSTEYTSTTQTTTMKNHTTERVYTLTDNKTTPSEVDIDKMVMLNTTTIEQSTSTLAQINQTIPTVKHSEIYAEQMTSSSALTTEIPNTISPITLQDDTSEQATTAVKMEMTSLMPDVLCKICDRLPNMPILTSNTTQYPRNKIKILTKKAEECGSTECEERYISLIESIIATTQDDQSVTDIPDDEMLSTTVEPRKNATTLESNIGINTSADHADRTNMLPVQNNKHTTERVYSLKDNHTAPSEGDIDKMAMLNSTTIEQSTSTLAQINQTLKTDTRSNIYAEQMTTSSALTTDEPDTISSSTMSVDTSKQATIAAKVETASIMPNVVCKICGRLPKMPILACNITKFPWNEIKILIQIAQKCVSTECEERFVSQIASLINATTQDHQTKAHISDDEMLSTTVASCQNVTLFESSAVINTSTDHVEHISSPLQSTEAQDTATTASYEFAFVYSTTEVADKSTISDDHMTATISSSTIPSDSVSEFPFSEALADSTPYTVTETLNASHGTMDNQTFTTQSYQDTSFSISEQQSYSKDDEQDGLTSAFAPGISQDRYTSSLVRSTNGSTTGKSGYETSTRLTSTEESYLPTTTESPATSSEVSYVTSLQTSSTKQTTSNPTYTIEPTSKYQKSDATENRDNDGTPDVLSTENTSTTQTTTMKNHTTERVYTLTDSKTAHSEGDIDKMVMLNSTTIEQSTSTLAQINQTIPTVKHSEMYAEQTTTSAVFTTEILDTISTSSLQDDTSKQATIAVKMEMTSLMPDVLCKICDRLPNMPILTSNTTQYPWNKIKILIKKAEECGSTECEERYISLIESIIATTQEDQTVTHIPDDEMLSTTVEPRTNVTTLESNIVINTSTDHVDRTEMSSFQNKKAQDTTTAASYEFTFVSSVTEVDDKSTMVPTLDHQMTATISSSIKPFEKVPYNITTSGPHVTTTEEYTDTSTVLGSATEQFSELTRASKAETETSKTLQLTTVDGRKTTSRSKHDQYTSLQSIQTSETSFIPEGTTVTAYSFPYSGTAESDTIVPYSPTVSTVFSSGEISSSDTTTVTTSRSEHHYSHTDLSNQTQSTVLSTLSALASQTHSKQQSMDLSTESKYHNVTTYSSIDNLTPITRETTEFPVPMKTGAVHWTEDHVRDETTEIPRTFSTTIFDDSKTISYASPKKKEETDSASSEEDMYFIPTVQPIIDDLQWWEDYDLRADSTSEATDLWLESSTIQTIDAESFFTDESTQKEQFITTSQTVGNSALTESSVMFTTSHIKEPHTVIMAATESGLFVEKVTATTEGATKALEKPEIIDIISRTNTSEYESQIIISSTTEQYVTSAEPTTRKLSVIRYEVDVTSNNTYPSPKKETFEYIQNKTITKGTAKLTFRKIKVTVIRTYEAGKRVVLRTYQKVKDIVTTVTVTTYRRSRELLQLALHRIEALWQYCKTGIDHYIVKPLLDARVYVKEKFQQTYATLSELFDRGKEILKTTSDNVQEESSSYFDSLTKYYTDVYRQYSTEVRDIFESLKIPDS